VGMRRGRVPTRLAGLTPALLLPTRTVLVNSNPATIMTDMELGDADPTGKCQFGLDSHPSPPENSLNLCRSTRDRRVSQLISARRLVSASTIVLLKSAPRRLARSKTAPLRLAPLRFAPERLADQNLAKDKSAERRLAPLRSASLKYPRGAFTRAFWRSQAECPASRLQVGSHPLSLRQKGRFL
jgi:hypothetical protein